MAEQDYIAFIYKVKEECKTNKVSAKDFALKVVNGVLSTNDLFNSLFNLGYKEPSIYNSLEQIYNE